MAYIILIACNKQDICSDLGNTESLITFLKAPSPFRPEYGFLAQLLI